MARAQAEGVVLEVGSIVNAGLSPSTKTTATTKQVLGKDGAVVELHETRVETLPPDPTNLRWHVEHRFPRLWGRSAIEVGTGDNPLPMDDDTPDRVRALIAEVEAYKEGVRDGQREASRREDAERP